MARTEDPLGHVIGETQLSYAGERSIFEGTVSSSGATRLVVIASQPDQANFGRAEHDLQN